MPLEHWSPHQDRDVRSSKVPAVCEAPARSPRFLLIGVLTHCQGIAPDSLRELLCKIDILWFDGNSRLARDRCESLLECNHSGRRLSWNHRTSSPSSPNMPVSRPRSGQNRTDLRTMQGSSKKSTTKKKR